MHGEMIHQFNAFDFHVRWMENAIEIHFKMFFLHKKNCTYQHKREVYDESSWKYS